jgi:hypothetical protein
MAGFEYREALEIRNAFEQHQVRYLFIGSSGAVLLGFPDSTRQVELFVEKTVTNCERLVHALVDLGFSLTEEQSQEIRRGKDFIQLKNGPFDLDLIFSPDGIEKFADAWNRRVDVEGFPVCNIDDIVSSKQAANRRKDKETLPGCCRFETG